MSPIRSLLLLALSGAPWLVPAAYAWPDGPAPGTEPSECVDLSSVPVNYDVMYSMDDYPAGTDPASVTTILEDIFNFSGGCTGCHNGSAADGGGLRLNAASSVLRMVYALSYRNNEILRVLPGDPERSLLYAMLNCEPPPTYPWMPPSMDGNRIDISLRALVYDWIAAGARGRDQDGNLASDVLFRDQLESERFQRYLLEPPP